MADTAAHLIDRVFPHVPVRQWVLSLPFAGWGAKVTALELAERPIRVARRKARELVDEWAATHT